LERKILCQGESFQSRKKKQFAKARDLNLVGIDCLCPFQPQEHAKILKAMAVNTKKSVYMRNNQ
jgi:hypothetical protein